MISEESRKSGKELRDSETTSEIIAAAIAVHREIVRSYLKATNLADGMILNFSTVPLTVKRVRRERTFEAPDLHR